MHCQIADYWSKELGKAGIHAYQASKRGGHLYCEMLDNGRIAISGEATLVAVSEIVAEQGDNRKRNVMKTKKNGNNWTAYYAVKKNS